MKISTSSTPICLQYNKCKQFKTETKTIFNYLYLNTATAGMVCEATGIKHKNITRYKRDLEKAGLLIEVEKKTCKASGYKGWYLTTNKDLFPTQLNNLNK